MKKKVISKVFDKKDKDRNFLKIEGNCLIEA